MNSVKRARVGSQPNHPFYQPQVALDRDAVLLVLLNRGYQAAAVDVRVAFSEDYTRADLTFTVADGPQVFVDHVLIVGNERTATETIRREVTLKPEAPTGIPRHWSMGSGVIWWDGKN